MMIKATMMTTMVTIIMTMTIITATERATRNMADRIRTGSAKKFPL